MNCSRWFLTLIAIFLLLSCSSGDGDDNDTADIGYVAPQPPVQPLQENMFQLRLFSRFSGEALFSSDNYTAVKNEMSTVTNAYVSFLDRVGVEYFGERSNPTVAIAGALGQVSFFAALDYHDDSIEGIGIIVKGLVSDYEGKRAADGFLIAGPAVRILITKSFMLKAGTCSISSEEQINSFSEVAESFVLDRGLVVGTIKASLKDKLETHMRMNAVNFRLSFMVYDEGAAYVPFVYGPLDYTYRAHEMKALGDDIHCMTISMEAL